MFRDLSATTSRIGLSLFTGVCVLGAGCQSGPEPPPPQVVTGPAVTIAPPAPAGAPGLNPHTRVDVSPLSAAPADPDAAAWRPILLQAGEDLVPALPTGAALEADLRLAAEYRAAAPDEWARTADWWAAGAVRRWNEIARHLLQIRVMNSGYSARMFALLAVAQYDAALVARRVAQRVARESGDAGRLAEVGRGQVEPYGYPSQEAAIAWASVEVLRRFYPPEQALLEQNAMAHLQSRIWMGAILPSDAEAGKRIGVAAGEAAMAWANQDGIHQVNEGRVSRQDGKWYDDVQVLPGFGRLKPWTLRSGDQFRSPPPPAVDSPEFTAAVAEIRAYSDRLSAEQLAVAQYWNLGVGGISVPGMWDLVGLDLARDAGHSELRTARTLALLNMAMMDACIASWDTKYHYLVPRPSQMDPLIREPIGLPPHPSYTSGHSAFSGAAEGILSALFPHAAEELHRMAEEASASRWYGGIHYRFDGDEGLRQGREVAAWVLADRASKESSLQSAR